MKRLLVLSMLIALAICLAVPAYADSEISINGQVRVRPEFSNKNFGIPKKTEQYTFLRTRIGVTAKIDKNTTAFVQFQDSRKLGDPESGNLADREKVDVHQAYLQVNHLWENGIGVRAGRFEVNFGNQRVFGGVGWHNVGRSWEGFMAWHNIKHLTLTAFHLKKMELNNEDGNRDYDVFGLYSHCNRYNVDLFAIAEHDADLVSETSDKNILDRYSVGTYFKRSFNSLDFEFNGVYQFGTMRDETEAETDIAAFMFTAEAGYTFDSELNPKVAAGVDYTSGDDEDDNKYKAYNNLYYTGHKFRGYMDYFLGSPEYGLIDMMFRAKINPTEGWIIKGDFHYFTATVDYSDFNSKTSKDIGMEFDLTVATKRVAGVGVAVGGGVFMPKESFAGFEDPETAFWLFTQLTANFK